MAISIKHCFVTVFLLLTACGQGQEAQPPVPETTAQTVTPPAVAAESTPPQMMESMQTQMSDQMQNDMKNMNMDMSGMDHSAHMMGSQPAPGTLQPTGSKNGLFKASVTSEVEPVVINQLHSWTLHLTRVDGTPVEDATITVSGTMPAHAHGMPTSPQVTANLGGGSYKVEGMQFQMGGEWEVTFNITSGTQTDDIVFHLTLQ